MRAQGDGWPRLAVVMGDRQAAGRGGGLPECPLASVDDSSPPRLQGRQSQAIQPFVASSLLGDPDPPTEQTFPDEGGRLLAFLSSGRLGPIVLKIWGL